MKRIITIIILLTCMFSFNGCYKEKEIKKPDDKEKEVEELHLHIYSTNKLLFKMITAMAGTNHYVGYMFSDEKELRDFEVKDDSIDSMNDMDLFFYMGSGFEPWINKFINKINKDKTRVIDTSRGISKIELNTPIEYKDELLEYSPYYWMNPINYRIQLLNIKNAIQEKDPRNRDIYEGKFDEHIKKITEYDEEMKELVSNMEEYMIVVDSEKLKYFTKYYNLETIDISKIEETDEEIIDEKKFIYLYTLDEKNEKTKEILDKYKIKACKFIIFDGEYDYIQMMKKNYESLFEQIKNTQIKKL